MNNIIDINGLGKTYEKGLIKALSNVDLTIKRGSFVSIIGPSGSGKSSLLNIIGALDTADEGKVFINGEDISHVHNLSKFRRNNVGFVFQLHNLIPNLTSIENVELPMYGTGLKSNDMKKHAFGLLKAVGLQNLVNKKPNVLSGGERQRVAVARALVNKPPIILADEPTGSLDAENGENIMDLLKYHQKKLGATLIIVTHNQQIAKQADQIIKICDGKLI